MPRKEQKTQLTKILVKRFRALNEIEVELGSHVTVICGKNGTSKSSLLGIAAQIFSFEKDYARDEVISFQTITGENFKSLPSEHFRFSNRFDIPGSMEVSVELFDGYTQSRATAELGLFERGGAKARPVVRKNSTATSGNDSRNFTHPVIFLSLKRLLPIAARRYKVEAFDYLQESKNSNLFLALTNELLNKTSSIATSTSGSISSAVAHGNDYDQDSVSAGEDNVGQIVLALMAFKKLSEEYAHYNGGLLLLIDESDAGLFPAAQIRLLDILHRECGTLGIQVLMTSHSPTLIEYAHELGVKYPRRFKTVYLSDTYGAVQAMHDMSWADISADLHTKTVLANSEISLPEVNVYFEDGEGFDLFSLLAMRQPWKKFIKPMKDVSLGCSNYIQLARRKVPEFSNKSIICLDADAKDDAEGITSILILPGALPPDQLIFEYLYNLPPDDPLWHNSIKFTKAVFTQTARPILTALNLQAQQINLRASVLGRNPDSGEKKKTRELFKNFYKNNNFQQFLALKTKQHNPWKRWIEENPDEKERFVRAFLDRLKNIMLKEFFVDPVKLSALERPAA